MKDWPSDRVVLPTSLYVESTLLINQLEIHAVCDIAGLRQLKVLLDDYEKVLTKLEARG